MNLQLAEKSVHHHGAFFKFKVRNIKSVARPDGGRTSLASRVFFSSASSTLTATTYFVVTPEWLEEIIAS